MKKSIKCLVTTSVIVSSLSIANFSPVSAEIVAFDSSEKITVVNQDQVKNILFQEEEITDFDKLVEHNKKRNFIFKGQDLSPVEAISNAEITPIDGSRNTSVGVKVEQATQLLSVKEMSDGTLRSEYVVNTRATATDAQESSSVVGNVVGYAKVYYHKERPNTNTVWNTDMNYAESEWKVPISSTTSVVSNRVLTMVNRGGSSYGSNSQFVEKKVYPSGNARQRFDVPDSWLPLFKGLQGVSTQSKVVISRSTYNMKVDCWLHNFS